jgi:hypothetical protein
LILDDDEHHGRAKLVASKDALPVQVGCHGMAQFVETLSYTSYANLWNLPIAHAGLYGGVKNFWNFGFEKKRKGEPLRWHMIEGL